MEIFLLKITYLDEIITKVGVSNKGINIKQWAESMTTRQLIDRAKQEVFLAWSHAQHLSTDVDILMQRTDLCIRIVLMDLKNENICREYTALRQHDKTAYNPSNTHLNKFKGCSHIQIKVVDFIFPVYLTACDMDTSVGLIKASHMLNNNNMEEVPIIELTTADKGYDLYNKQIKNIWRLAKELPSNHFF